MAQSTSRNDSARGVPGLPREGGGAPLSGRVVLLPRLKERDRIASALERAGAMVLRAAVTRTVPGEAAALEATARRIVAGEAAWLVLTSARTVEALVPYLLAEAGVGSAIWRHGLHQEPGTPAPHDSASTPAIPPLRVAAAVVAPMATSPVLCGGGPSRSRTARVVDGAVSTTASTPPVAHLCSRFGGRSWASAVTVV